MFITIFFLSFIKINSEKWWPHVNGYDLNDVNDGFAGSSHVPAVDFYLCSERNYRVHYLGDDPMNWSKNFSNCDPVGIGRIIDGICLYGPKSYKGRLYHGVNWMGVIKGCNIDEKDGFAGKLGSPLACIAINGKEYYRIGYLPVAANIIVSSNPKNASDRIVNALFGEKVINIANYDEINELDLSADNNIKFGLFKAYIKLLNTNEINLDGSEIKLIFGKELIKFNYWGIQKLNNCLTKKIKNLLNFDMNEERKLFEEKIAKEIINGILTIHSDFAHESIQIDIGSKITDDFDGFRGGIRLNLKLNQSEKLIEFIKKVIKLISDYVDNKSRKIILDKLKNFKSIGQLDEISKLIQTYDIILTQIILFFILKRS